MPGEDGFLDFQKNDVILDRFELHEVLGQGTFGQVVRAMDKSTNTLVALKIIKDVKKYKDASKYEIKVLTMLGKLDKEKNHWIIHLEGVFEHGGHVCLMFDLLGPSVYDFMKKNDSIPYPMHQIIHISWQLCNAVKFLHDNKVTHTDLKPENLVFVDGGFSTEIVDDKPVNTILNSHVRLIDFGSATFENDHHSRLVSTRHYRAPEVILELGWATDCDVFSIGCMLFELYTGKTLFQTHNNREHLAMMRRILGDIPQRMVRKTKTNFFKSNGLLDWDAKSPDAVWVRENCFPIRRAMKSKEKEHALLFELMEDMLSMEPMGRATLSEAIEHPLFERLPEAQRTSLE